MKFNFTKGPWEFKEFNVDDYGIFQKDTNQPIAFLFSNIYNECSISLDIDNARLISCAPEMLEMLIEMVKFLRWDRFSSTIS